MTTHAELVGIARRLRDEVALTNMSGSLPDLDKAADEAAYWLELLAPLMPVLLPLLSGVIRQRVESHRLENERRMTDELAKSLARVTDGNPSVTSLLEAARTLDHYRELRGVTHVG